MLSIARLETFKSCVAFTGERCFCDRGSKRNNIDSGVARPDLGGTAESQGRVDRENEEERLVRRHYPDASRRTRIKEKQQVGRETNAPIR